MNLVVAFEAITVKRRGAGDLVLGRIPLVVAARQYRQGDDVARRTTASKVILTAPIQEKPVTTSMLFRSALLRRHDELCLKKRNSDYRILSVHPEDNLSRTIRAYLCSCGMTQIPRVPYFALRLVRVGISRSQTDMMTNPSTVGAS